MKRNTGKVLGANKLMRVLISIGLCVAFVSCGKEEVTTSASSTVQQPVEESIDVETGEEQDSVIVEEKTEQPNEVRDTDGVTEEHTPEAAPGADQAAGDVSTGYVDFDKMDFYINGKEYILGSNTLQEMIDDGVPFNKDDLNNAENNINGNNQSGGYRIELGEYYSAQVYVLNDTNEGKKESECVISKIYLPNERDEQQDILSFNFPLDMTMEELIANAGEPSDQSHYDGEGGYFKDTVKYVKPSEKYYLNSEYIFEFENSELSYITISYIP